MSSLVPVRSCAVAAIAALLVAAVGVHPPPTVWVETRVESDHVESLVTGEMQVWNEWLNLRVPESWTIEPDDMAHIERGAGKFFAEFNPVRIDGELVRPVVTRVGPPEDPEARRGLPAIAVTLRYACASLPKTVDFQWQTFDATDWLDREGVPAMIKHGRDVVQAVFTPREPQYVWRPPAPRPKTVIAAMEPPPPAHLLVPLASLGLLAGLFVAFPLIRRLRSSKPLAWTTAGVGVVLAILIRDIGTVELRAPWESVQVPEEHRALELFETLHRNIYRAFAASSEDEIYDLLAVSVAPSLLEDLYGEVYESLVLRGQGGAVCDIEDVEVLERGFEEHDDDAPRFGVDWSWQVHGKVSHWGHTHERTNKYRAQYTVQYDGRGWKIAGIRVLQHERYDR